MTTIGNQLDPRWHTARTLSDLGELTALWLERTIVCHPGYGDWESDDPGPDQETAEIVGPLAKANRAGYVTDCSQPGCIKVRGWDGSWWDQRAAVTGYATIRVRDRLLTQVRGHELIVIDTPMAILPGQRYRNVTPVTWRNKEEHTWFGHRFGILDLLRVYGSRSWRLNMRLAAARQITIIDPEPGRNDLLWPLLAQLSDTPEAG